MTSGHFDALAACGVKAQLGYPQPPHFFSGYTTGGAAAPSAPLRPAVMYTSVTRVIYICKLYSSYHALARGFLALLQGGHRQGVRQILSSGAFFWNFRLSFHTQIQMFTLHTYNGGNKKMDSL